MGVDVYSITKSSVKHVPASFEQPFQFQSNEEVFEFLSKLKNDAEIKPPKPGITPRVSSGRPKLAVEVQILAWQAS